MISQRPIGKTGGEGIGKPILLVIAMKFSKTRSPVSGLAWVALGLLAAYSMFGVFTAISMRPIDPIVRLSLLYYPRRFVPSVPWHVEDHVINTLLFGLPVIVKLVNGLNR